MPASCPHLIVLHSDGVQEEERETLNKGEPPLCPALPGMFPNATARDLCANLEKSPAAGEQSPREWSHSCGADARRAWHMALTP